MNIHEGMGKANYLFSLMKNELQESTIAHSMEGVKAKIFQKFFFYTVEVVETESSHV